MPHSFKRGDALFFLSHKYHGVSSLTSGRRQIIVAEIWEGLPRRCPQRCDNPWLPCYCNYKPFTLYERHSRGAYERIGMSDIEKLRIEGLKYYRTLADETESARDTETSRESEHLDLSDIFVLGVKGNLRPGD